MVDLDVSGKGFTHWLAVSDSAGASGSIGPSTAAFKLGNNDFGSAGYGGPCPPPGEVHHYQTTVTALSRQIAAGLPGKFSRDQLNAALRTDSSAIVARGSLTATYQRQG